MHVGNFRAEGRGGHAAQKRAGEQLRSRTRRKPSFYGDFLAAVTQGSRFGGNRKPNCSTRARPPIRLEYLHLSFFSIDPERGLPREVNDTETFYARPDTLRLVRILCPNFQNNISDLEQHFGNTRPPMTCCAANRILCWSSSPSTTSTDIPGGMNDSKSSIPSSIVGLQQRLLYQPLLESFGPSRARLRKTNVQRK